MQKKHPPLPLNVFVLQVNHFVPTLIVLKKQTTIVFLPKPAFVPFSNVTSQPTALNFKV